MPVEMQISRVLMSETQDTHFVELREVDPEAGSPPRAFPIVIGFTEAAAVERRLLGQSLPRPLTHDLMSDVIDTLGYRVDRVLISDLCDHTFYARLCLRSRSDPTRRHEIDARPSDAIAVGASTQVPIFVEEAVLEAACQS